MMTDIGRAPSGQALVASDQAPAGLDPSDFDPSRILVCGGRYYDDRRAVYAVLDHLKPQTVIAGGARGADTLASDWAHGLGKAKLETYLADWNRHGKGAGPIRNQQMLDEGKPTMVVFFPGGRGTEDMVRRARAAGILTVPAIDAIAMEARQGRDGEARLDPKDDSAGRKASPTPNQEHP